MSYLKKIQELVQEELELIEMEDLTLKPPSVPTFVVEKIVMADIESGDYMGGTISGTPGIIAQLNEITAFLKPKDKLIPVGRRFKLHESENQWLGTWKILKHVQDISDLCKDSKESEIPVIFIK